MQEKSLEQVIIKLQEQGIPNHMIADYIQKMADAMAPQMSQQDGVTISQFNPNVPGVFIDADLQNQNTFNETMRLQERMYANEGLHKGSAPRPVTQEEAVMAMAKNNPLYKVVEPSQTTVNSQGHIVHY